MSGKELGLDFSQLDQLSEEERNNVLKEFRDKLDKAVQKNFLDRFAKYLNEITSQMTFRQFFDLLPTTEFQNYFWGSNVYQFSTGLLRSAGMGTDSKKDEEIAYLKDKAAELEVENQRLRSAQRGFGETPKETGKRFVKEAAEDRRIRLNDAQIADLMEKIVAVLRSKNAQHPETGVSREQITQAMSHHKIANLDIYIDSKHLTRPMERLLEDNKMSKVGEKRSTKYYLVTASSPVTDSSDIDD
jgi:hypothetical protein